MEKPLISFVLPTKNRIEWIGESLASLMYQTENNIEIIVINDGSTDETDEFLESDFVKNDKRVKVINHPESIGAGLSRNEGSKLAQADIVCQFDDDDVCLGDRAETTLSWFKYHPESELVNFPYVRIDHLNKIMEKFPGEEFDEKKFTETGEVNYFSNPTVAYKKSSFEETKGYGKESIEATDDYIFVINWLNSGKKVDFCIGDPVVLHRVLKDSMMAKFRGFNPSWAQA
jgi:glycosyltransferase involved in cell wall biosynthesis